VVNHINDGDSCQLISFVLEANFSKYYQPCYFSKTWKGLTSISIERATGKLYGQSIFEWTNAIGWIL